MTKILLVEDDLNLQEIYKARLIAEGFDVVVSADGESALATAVAEKPDIIILDIMMPKISGFDVLDIIRSTPEVKDTKVILLTALSQAGDRERGEQLGANKYLVKSQITLEDVVQAVHETIGDTPAPSNGTDDAAKTPGADDKLPGAGTSETDSPATQEPAAAAAESKPASPPTADLAPILEEAEAAVETAPAPGQPAQTPTEGVPSPGPVPAGDSDDSDDDDTEPPVAPLTPGTTIQPGAA